MVVTVNAHAKEVQKNPRTGKEEHYGSYLIQMDLIDEQQLRVPPKQ